MIETETLIELLVLVDPDREILHTFSRFLERKGYAVATAADGSEALAQLSRRRPDLIVIEPMLSDNWGERVLEQYYCTASGVPVIGVSKSSVSKVPFPFCAYFVKPVSLVSLLQTIQTSLQPNNLISGLPCAMTVSQRALLNRMRGEVPE